MNIRLKKENEIEDLVRIWYEGSLIAHDFIDEAYWKSQRKDMKEKYLPMSETYVISNKTKIVGFISMIDTYLAALFVDHRHQGNGYGKELLHFIKAQKESIQLKVYQKNKQAFQFYLKNDFIVKKDLLDESTGEKEFLMEWMKL